MLNSFSSRTELTVGDEKYTIHRLDAVDASVAGARVATLPFALRVLLENLLRNENGQSVRAEDIEALARWDAHAAPAREIAFTPSRVLLQDYTGVPALVDLAAMRDAMQALGGDPKKINPLQPVDLVIDHSVQVDDFGTDASFGRNAALEFSRNRERYLFLKWGQNAFANFRVVPPDTGIVHQVNLEHLARVVSTNDRGEAYPDTVVGTDSHTTMVNGLGVLGWGVGGIEAEAAMLGQPVSMLIPQVVGMRLTGKLSEGATATDLVLVVTEMLRKKGVVGKFVEFFGPGLPHLSLADRATIANMAPEYGATCGLFPVDDETLRYLRFTGRSAPQVALVEAYYKAQGMFHGPGTPEAVYSATLELDLTTVQPCVAGPKRPQDRVLLAAARGSFEAALAELPGTTVAKGVSGKELTHGSVVVAAITSCTNTSNPSVLVAAGLLAKKACEKGLTTKPWVKTSLAPGSKVVTEYLDAAGLSPYLAQLRFNLVGYGCTTCIGNSGPLPAEVSREIGAKNLFVCSVLSGNRNFEGRIHPEVRANYLASPPLVVAYALAGTLDIDLTKDPVGDDRDGRPVFLADLWPSQHEIQQTMERCLKSEMFGRVYGDVFKGDVNWRSLGVSAGDLYPWDPDSMYVKHPPYFEGMDKKPGPLKPIRAARVLALLGDSVTTDHISPAGPIEPSGPAGAYLFRHGVGQKDFNSYGARRGNHEVMVRGTFANVRLRNELAPETEGGVTRHLPSNQVMSIFDASERYRNDRVSTVILAGKDYGAGSSRDWAGKGPRLLGVRAVIAESYERIHRSNLVGMGVLPLQFEAGENAAKLGLTGEELFDVMGLSEMLAGGFEGGRRIAVRATRPDGVVRELHATVRIDTPQEVLYYQHGGILQYVLRQLLAQG